MSLAGLGFGNLGHGYCHMCNSPSCHHIMGGQQNMNNEAYYNMLRQYGEAQQQSSIMVAKRGEVSIEEGVTAGKSITVGQTETKPNRKLLLLKG